MYSLVIQSYRQETLSIVRGDCKGWSQVIGYCVYVSGRPTLLSRTELRTLSSRLVATKQSGAKSVRKLFPKNAAWWTEGYNTALTVAESYQEDIGMAFYPEQCLLGDRVIFVTGRLHALVNCLPQHALFLNLSKVLICLLTGFL